MTVVTHLVSVYLTVLMRLEEAHQPRCQSRREEPSLGLVLTGVEALAVPAFVQKNSVSKIYHRLRCFREGRL